MWRSEREGAINRGAAPHRVALRGRLMRVLGAARRLWSARGGALRARGVRSRASLAPPRTRRPVPARGEARRGGAVSCTLPPGSLGLRAARLRPISVLYVCTIRTYVRRVSCRVVRHQTVRMRLHRVDHHHHHGHHHHYRPRVVIRDMHMWSTRDETRRDKTGKTHALRHG